VKKIIILLLSIYSFGNAQAQLTISAQLRPRAEYRNGLGSPSVKDTVPAGFISQRTRLNISHAQYRFKSNIVLQDVRVWGQDASSIHRTTSESYNGLMIHEAWGEISLVDTGKVIKNFYLKVGRQELIYDDSRLLGNLDWLQQARRHDAALLKFEHDGWTAHAGLAFNQNAERKSNTIYNGAPAGYPAGTNGMTAMYKSMQFLYVARKLSFGSASLLAFKDNFSKFHFDPADAQKKFPIYERATWSRFTWGATILGDINSKVSFNASGYYQGGNYRDGTPLNEYLISVYTAYAPQKKMSFGAGVDITSGNNGSDPTRKFQRFDPLYGTPHKFWGAMDYFYAADPFGSNGLVDYYLKSKFKTTEKFQFSLDAHQFYLPAAVSDENNILLDKALGTEIDLILLYHLTGSIYVEAGYSSLFSTATLTSVKVKNVRNADTFSDWAYLMIVCKPTLLKSK